MVLALFVAKETIDNLRPILQLSLAVGVLLGTQLRIAYLNRAGLSFSIQKHAGKIRIGSRVDGHRYAINLDFGCRYDPA